MRLISIHIFKW